MNDSASDALFAVFSYHERSKHRPERYARSLGYLDWANQPNPFRQYADAPVIELGIPAQGNGPRYDDLFAALPEPARLDPDSVSRLLYFGMSISAWKKVPDGEAWPLRVNPSSGNLHPTESWLICGPNGLNGQGGLFHYAVDQHKLEQRLGLDADQWAALVGTRSESGFLLGLSSVCWREAWKYGERAYRYTNHDVGHALGALAVSAASLGWSVHLLDVEAGVVSRLMGLGTESEAEREHADCLLWVSTGKQPDAMFLTNLSGQLETAIGDDLMSTHAGVANPLSHQHQDWPVLEEIAIACEDPLVTSPRDPRIKSAEVSGSPLFPPREVDVWSLVRQRRSAVAMDAKTCISANDFLRMLWRVMPGGAFPWSVSSRVPKISLVLFVHRVDDLEPGVYVLVRDPEHLPALQVTMRSEFAWEKPEACGDLPLYRLLSGDCRQAAQIISCHQEIAADGVFACGMLARFRESLEQLGPAAYPRLYWETGLIGQLLYLEAEAAGVRATGIGCFFDDHLHDLLGIADDHWQSLYHFTVGGPLEDTRLQTLPGYTQNPEPNP